MGYNFFKITPLNVEFRQKLKAFTASLGPAISAGAKIPFADDDISYVLQLQHERIKRKGLAMEYEVYDRDDTRHATVGSEWKDEHYESYVCSEQYGVKRRISKGGTELFSDNKKNILFATIADVTSGIHPDDETCCCPNCGNIGTIAQIQGGCPYCGTVHKMDDLFPKVTSYYFLNDVALAGNEGKKGLGLSMLITVLALLFATGIGILIRGERFNPESVLGMIIVIPIGMLLGYMVYSLFLATRLIAVGSSQSSGKWGTIGSRSKFEQRMRAYGPEFSFEYFTSKAISLIKAAVYAPSEQELRFYRGEPLDHEFKDIIDLNYGGALGVVGIEEENGLVAIATDAFFDVLYATDAKVEFRRETFRAIFQRRADIPIDMHFSMTKIQCPTCGGSFNAVKNKMCPYCDNEYDLVSQDWVLAGLWRE